MAKKVKAIVKLAISAGKATPAPPAVLNMPWKWKKFMLRCTVLPWRTWARKPGNTITTSAPSAVIRMPAPPRTSARSADYREPNLRWFTNSQFFVTLESE